MISLCNNRKPTIDYYPVDKKQVFSKLASFKAEENTKHIADP